MVNCMEALRDLMPLFYTFDLKDPPSSASNLSKPRDNLIDRLFYVLFACGIVTSSISKQLLFRPSRNLSMVAIPLLLGPIRS